MVNIVRGGVGKLENKSRLLTKDRKGIRFEVQSLVLVFPDRIRDGVEQYLLGLFKQGRVLYQYNSQATRADIEAAVKAITPEEVSESYEVGQRLVQSTAGKLRAGRAGGLTPEELALLRAEHQAYWAEAKHQRPWAVWAHVGGRAVLAVLITALLCFYISHYQPRIAKNHWRGFAVAIVLLLTLAVNKTLSCVPGWNPHWSILPVLLTAIIFVVAYNQRFAMTIGFVLATLAVLQLRSSFATFVVLSAGVAAAIFLLKEIRTRSKLIEISVVSAATAFVTVWAFALASSEPWGFALADSLWAAGFAILAGFLAQGILPVIERLFRIATSMTLLEWCDASKPLLKRLAMEAPGTYNHSLQLGSMCEAAAEAIGARGLLARVGAYYHDIGKIHKPDYFIENQGTEPSRHEKLSPAMSLLVIIGHVKDGLEMAREYGLPPVLREFIASHHGTTLVQYFYQAAAEKRKNGTGRAPDETEFRYPGPKPKSKEAAILMLADAAESSVRAMSEPTPGRIENQVHTMVTRRLMDGQLDECDLMLKEVHQIEVSLIKSLCSIYHARIAYPAPAGEKPSAAETPAEKFPAEKPADAGEGPGHPAGGV